MTADDQLLAQVDRFLRERIAAARDRARAAAQVFAWDVPGEPVSFTEASGQVFTPVDAGHRWGRPWGTTWLRIKGTVPPDWLAGGAYELVVDLGFDAATPGFQCEGLAWSNDGAVIKGLAPRNSHVPVSAGPGEQFSLYVEAAANPQISDGWSFRPTPLGDLATAGHQPLYVLGGAWLVLPDDTVRSLESDLIVLRQLVDVLPPGGTRRARIVAALSDAVDALDPDDVAISARRAVEVLAPVLAARADANAHHVIAVGHAHIDSAWLWPVRETKRKVARTFANVLELMERHPDFVFAASSAQQYQWLAESYPELFERVRERVREGRFVPVGGMWVESDTNMPGGEALIRQFLHGQEFFFREFGVRSREVWLPDSFGYSAAMPQIARLVGCEFFLTQKTSWNDTNRMPHHTFLWEGIDGTRIFTHFPPVDTYNSTLSAEELARAERQHAERGRSDRSLVPFGHGDGGGGPTREMLATAARKTDLAGSPTVELAAPVALFERAQAELADPAVWSGELYLEFHRGTYTSQARTKIGNRRSEHLLREAELWATTATVRTGAPYPYEKLRRAWQTALLQQFHDILPGSSIAWVHQEAERNYAGVAADLEAVIVSATDRLRGPGAGTGEIAFNAAPFAIEGVPPLGAGPRTAQASTAERAVDGFVITSPHLQVRIDFDGRLVSLTETRTGRDAIAPGTAGNELQFFRDIPARWDAWDLDRAYERARIDDVQTVDIRLDGVEVALERTVGSSRVRQRISISPDGRALDIVTVVDWHEQQKLLKLAFPFDVHADTAASEIQFGHLRRPTHANTSWDMARFETVAHRWVRVDEPDFGVTLANDRVYGHDVTRTTRADGGTTTTVRESLLRAPRFPDPHSDQGRHGFRHALRVGSLLEGIAEGYRVNLPLRRGRGADVEPLVTVDNPGVVVEAVKLAQDDSGDVIVRVYESRGARAQARLTPNFATTTVSRTDGLERPLAEQPREPTTLNLRPFEIVTIRLGRDRQPDR